MKLLKILTVTFILLCTNFITAQAAQLQSREQIAWDKIGQGALIVDNRTPQEFAQGHLKNAINIPFDIAVTQFKQLNISRDQEIVLYCRSGNRSNKAFQSLMQAGYTKLYNGGGYQALMYNKTK
ncbi:MAG: phage shock protein E [Moritella sp.]|jgi:phage shock protein E